MGSENGSVLKTVLMWIVGALVIVAAIKLAFWVVGVAFGLGTFLLFTVAPIVILGWLTVKLIAYFRNEPI